MIINPKDWPLITQEARMKKGKLINVKISAGRCVKMYEADAIAQGYIKARPQAEALGTTNKMRQPPANKAAAPEEKPAADDFTTIPGVGPATARALVAHGITTFEQLRIAGDLAYLPGKASSAIAEWRAHETG